jgi:hypothetical protein
MIEGNCISHTRQCGEKSTICGSPWGSFGRNELRLELFVRMRRAAGAASGGEKSGIGMR